MQRDASSKPRRQAHIAFFVVGGAFLVGVAICWAIALHILRTQVRASTPLMAVVGMGWAVLTMTLSMALTMLGARVRAARLGARRGHVVISGYDPALARDRLIVEGEGVEAVGEADVEITSVLPAVLTAISTLMLAVVTIGLFWLGRTTPMGVFIGGLLCYFMSNWVYRMWPRQTTNDGNGASPDHQ
ncbi:hypothetical protein GJQ57_03200 [Ralstonia pickettii]|uniref:Transmembrane protein n=1 Tax=Ralstonia pickettii TaxID=329 RepID=A0A7X2L999_RALPI|nr:hypothetical protein [Ralstonia pickettii]MRS97655.1 hypothetical protein [Ralstonia pickettii]